MRGSSQRGRSSTTEANRKPSIGHRSLVALVAAPIACSVLPFVSPAVAFAAGCPALEVLGIQGTGQSSPNAPVNVDTGFLSEVMKPMQQQAGSLVSRVYVPYEASFGGAGPSTPGQNAPYAVSVQNAGNRAVKMMEETAGRCPNTKFALTGYSQGAHAVKGTLNMVLQGQTKIRPDQIAAVANFGDPGRPPGASLFPGKPGQTAPSAVPGTTGREVSKVRAASSKAPVGGGIGPSKDQNVDLAKVAGRYASFCADGDLACDAPTNTPLIGPLVHLVTNVGGQMTFDQNDPIKSISTIGQALAQTVVKAIAGPAAAPTEAAGPIPVFSSVAQRLEYASDPRNPLPQLGQALTPSARSGLIGSNATPVKALTTMTPQSVWGAANTAGASSPTQVAGALTPQLQKSVVSVEPPLTADLNVLNAFDQTKQSFPNPLDLMNVVGMFQKYADTGAKHTSYGKAASTPTGMPPTTFVAKWFAAAAKDIASGGSGQGSGLPSPQQVIDAVIKPLPALPGALSAAGLPPQVTGPVAQIVSAVPTPAGTPSAPTPAASSSATSTSSSAPTVSSADLGRAGVDLGGIDLNSILGGSSTSASTGTAPTTTSSRPK